MGKEVAFHPASDIFPLMDGKDLKILAEDILAKGLQAPIELLDGKILDGRNRYRACQVVDVEPEFVEVDPDDPVAYVISLNLHRRHLTKSGRAIAAQKAIDYYEAQAKKRQKVHGGTAPGKAKNTAGKVTGSDTSDSRDDAGAAFKVSGKYVDYAGIILDTGSSELIKAVERDIVTMPTAAKLAKRPKAEQNAALKGGKEAIKEATTTKKPAATNGRAGGGGGGKPKPQYPVSDQFVNWLGTVSGLCTKFRQDHKTIKAMMTCKGWDKDRTEFAADLLDAVRNSIDKLNKEVQNHVNGK